MTRLAWLTDIHLNFLSRDEVEAFAVLLAKTDADLFAITGDIGEAPDVTKYLNLLDSYLQRPIYFVLGNHDFYRGSIAGVREKIRKLCEAVPNLRYLTTAGVVPLTDKTCLIGHDGWADARFGDYWNSDVQMNDWRLIKDFVGLDQEQRLEKLRSLGDEAADHFHRILPDALERFEQVVALTHVPPFSEACLWQGRMTDDNWLPHFCCGAVGNTGGIKLGNSVASTRALNYYWRVYTHQALAWCVSGSA
jgi:Icc protein